MRYIVNVSGGLTSEEARRRCAAVVGQAQTISVFADTLIEDNDLYRFLIACHVDDSADLQAQAHTLPGLREMDARKAALADLRIAAMARTPYLVWLADGRTPFDVMREKRVIAMPNGAVPCSNLLKREMINAWLATQDDPYTLVFGMDWSEQHRMTRLASRYAPVPVWFPLASKPYLMKEDIAAILRAEGITPPGLYADGFAHNNCGGGCVKAGQAHWANLLRTRPDAYAIWEEHEAAMRAMLGKDIAICKDRSGGDARPLTLTALRERIACGGRYDRSAWGGCGCFVNEQLELFNEA